MKLFTLFIFFCSSIFFTSFSTDKNKPNTTIGNAINDFSLRNINNTIFSLNNNKNAKGYIVVFTCNHCPFAKLYNKRLNALNTKYKQFNVPLIAINSMDTLVYEEESFEMMQVKAKIAKFNFPYLYDAMQTVGKAFNAEHTPQAFIIWKENNNWIIKYSGAIDNNGEQPLKATPYIANAVDELLKKMPVSNPQIPSFGCKIYYRK